MTTEIAAYSETEAALSNLSLSFENVIFDVTTTEGMTEAKVSYKEINRYSILLEAARVKEKSESLAHGKLVDSEARKISDKLDGLRLPIKAQIETETKRVDRENEEKSRVIQEQLAAEQRAIKDAEEKKMADDRAEIDRQKVEIVEAQKASMKVIEDAERAHRMKMEEECRTVRLANEEADRTAREVRAMEEDARMKIRYAEESLKKIERDRLDLELRAANEIAETRALLELVIDRCGDAPEFFGIVLEIGLYLHGDQE